MTRICVYCGSTFGASAQYAALAAAFGAACARRGLGIVYGGGNVALMGFLASMLTVGTEVQPFLDEILTTRHVHIPKPIERGLPEPLNTDAK